MNAKEQARKWLIENNHHACHLLVDQQDGQRQDGTMPRPEDVESLAELLRGARAQRMTAGMDDQAAVATCRDCGATGVEMGFEHYCVPLAAYQDRRRIVEYMRARCSNVSHFANLTLLADDIENMPYETQPDSKTAVDWGVFDTWKRQWCPRRGTEDTMSEHAVRLNRKTMGAHGVTVTKNAAGELTDSTTYRYQPLPLPLL